MEWATNFDEEASKSSYLNRVFKTEVIDLGYNYRCCNQRMAYSGKAKTAN